MLRLVALPQHDGGGLHKMLRLAALAQHDRERSFGALPFTVILSHFPLPVILNEVKNLFVADDASHGSLSMTEAGGTRCFGSLHSLSMTGGGRNKMLRLAALAQHDRGRAEQDASARCARSA